MLVIYPNIWKVQVISQSRHHHHSAYLMHIYGILTLLAVTNMCIYSSRQQDIAIARQMAHSKLRLFGGNSIFKVVKYIWRLHSFLGGKHQWLPQESDYGYESEGEEISASLKKEKQDKAHMWLHRQVSTLPPGLEGVGSRTLNEKLFSKGKDLGLKRTVGNSTAAAATGDSGKNQELNLF